MGVARYSIDAPMSRFTVQAFAGGLLSALGHNPTIAIRDFSGEAELDPEKPDSAALRICIDAGSLVVTNHVSDKDRRDMERTMKEDVLETARFPEIRFESSGVPVSRAGNDRFAANLTGELSLHGVSNRLTIPVQFEVMGDTLRAHGEFSLKQTDYLIRLVSVAAERSN